MAVQFPANPNLGQIHTDAPSGKSWVALSNAQWKELSPVDAYPYNGQQVYSPGDLVYYPGNVPGIGRVFVNTSGNFLNDPPQPWDYANWTAVQGPLCRGMFNPTVNDGGTVGSDIPERVANNTAGYIADDYVIARQAGVYNFATGQQDPAGASIVPGQRIVYDGANWIPQNAPDVLFRGFFLATEDNGGFDQGSMPAPVINNDPTGVYVPGSYGFCASKGRYNFATGTANDVAGTDVDLGAVVTYDGLVWNPLQQAPDLNAGYMNPNEPFGDPINTAPDRVIDDPGQTTIYLENQYLIATPSSSQGVQPYYDFETGLPTTKVPDPTDPTNRSFDIPAGSRCIMGPDPARQWFVLPLITDIYVGSIQPDVNNGGVRVQYPIINGSGDYFELQTASINTQDPTLEGAWYDFGTGFTGPSAGATWCRNGEMFIYIGSTWQPQQRDNDFHRGSITQADLATHQPPIVDGTVEYEDRAYFISVEPGEFEHDFGNGIQEINQGARIYFDAAAAEWKVIKNGQPPIQIWTTGEDYAFNDFVWKGGPQQAIYRCAVPHIAGTNWVQDALQGYWEAAEGYLSTIKPSEGMLTEPQTIWAKTYYKDELQPNDIRIPVDDDEIITKRALDLKVGINDPSAVTELVSQPGHTFGTGQAVYKDPTTGEWFLARADAFGTVSDGIVIETPANPDTFIVCFYGILDFGVPHTLPVGSTFYLSETTDGLAEPIIPPTNGSYQQALWDVYDTTRVKVLDQAVSLIDDSRTPDGAFVSTYDTATGGPAQQEMVEVKLYTDPDRTTPRVPTLPAEIVNKEYVDDRAGLPAQQWNGLTDGTWYKIGSYPAYTQVAFTLRTFQSGVGSGTEEFSAVVGFAGGISIDQRSHGGGLLTEVRGVWNNGTSRVDLYAITLASSSTAPVTIEAKFYIDGVIGQNSPASWLATPVVETPTGGFRCVIRKVSGDTTSAFGTAKLPFETVPTGHVVRLLLPDTYYSSTVMTWNMQAYLQGSDDTGVSFTHAAYAAANSQFVKHLQVGSTQILNRILYADGGDGRAYFAEPLNYTRNWQFEYTVTSSRSGIASNLPSFVSTVPLSSLTIYDALAL